MHIIGVFFAPIHFLVRETFTAFFRCSEPWSYLADPEADVQLELYSGQLCQTTLTPNISTAPAGNTEAGPQSLTIASALLVHLWKLLTVIPVLPAFQRQSQLAAKRHKS